MRRPLRGLVAVVSRELVEHRLILVIGIVLALVSVALPHVVPTDHPSADVTTAAATALGIAYALILAFALGISGIPAELAGGQQSFFFSRPISSIAIWAGKLSAALFLALAGGLLAAVPATTGLSGWSPLQMTRAAVATVVAIAVVVCFAYFLSLSFRSRGPWLLFDLAWMLLALGLGYLSYALFSGASAYEAWQATLLGRLYLLAPCLVLATAVQVVLGRSDLTRSHRWLSLVVGVCVLLIASTMVIEARKTANPRPEKLAGIEMVEAASGGWLFARGWPVVWSQRHNATFLWHPDTGRFVHLGMTAGWPVSSASGSRIAWLERTQRNLAPTRLNWADLSEKSPRSRSWPASLSTSSRLCCLSPDGQNVVWQDGNRTSIASLMTGERIWSHVLEEGVWLALRFADNHTLRGLRRVGVHGGTFGLALDTYDISSGESETIDLEPTTWPNPQGVRWLADGTSLLIENGLYDSTTGSLLGRLDDGAGWRSTYAMLADGRGVTLEAIGLGSRATTVLNLYDVDGTRLKQLALGPSKLHILGGQLSQEEIVIVTYRDSSNEGPGSWESDVLNLATGERKTLHRTAFPIAAPGASYEDPTSRLFVDIEGALVRLTAEGEFEKLTKGGAKNMRQVYAWGLMRQWSSRNVLVAR